MFIKCVTTMNPCIKKEITMEIRKYLELDEYIILMSSCGI